MTITLYSNASEENRVTKDLTQIVELTGTLREGTNLLDPEILFNHISPEQISQTNYAYIPAFGRYYFVRDIRFERTNLARLSFHVDVLSTYSAQILAQTAVVSRQENQWNLYLNDGIFKTYQNPIIKTKLFPVGFTSQQYILAVAGSNK